MSTILATEGLTKRYGQMTAVNQLSLKVEQGQILGLLGPNGSGKTTTLGMVLGITRPSSGSFTWFGGQHDPQQRIHIGTLLETPNFYPYMSARKNLEIVARIKDVPREDVGKLLETVNLAQRGDSKYKTFSLGMKQRLAIAAALVGKPKVLIFDEPTNGLDPEGIAEVRRILLRIAQTGKTIIMASHILDEVEKICSHVAIIKNGHLLANGTVGAILSADKLIEVAAEDMLALEAELQKLEGLLSIDQEKGYLVATFPEGGVGAAQVNQLAFQKGITLTRLVERKRSLETEFLAITQGH